MKTNLHIRELLQSRIALVLGADIEKVVVLGDRVTSDGDVHGAALVKDQHFVVITLEATCAYTWGTVTDQAAALAWLEARTSSEPDFGPDQVATALNRAADQVLEIARDDGEELLRDAINLVVNAGLHFLSHPNASLEDAIRESYEDDFADELLDSLR